MSSFLPLYIYSLSLSRLQEILIIDIKSTNPFFEHSQGKSRYEKWNDRKLSSSWSRDHHDLFNSTQVGDYETRELYMQHVFSTRVAEVWGRTPWRQSRGASILSMCQSERSVNASHTHTHTHTNTHTHSCSSFCTNSFVYLFQPIALNRSEIKFERTNTCLHRGINRENIRAWEASTHDRNDENDRRNDRPMTREQQRKNG